MQDKPAAPDLLAAVADFIEEELLPLTASDPRLRFRSLIAINVLNIVQRELTESEPLLVAEWQRLSALFDQPDSEQPASLGQLKATITDYNRQISQALRQGQSRLDEAALTAHLETTVREKLQISNPRFLEREVSNEFYKLD